MLKYGVPRHVRKGMGAMATAGVSLSHFRFSPPQTSFPHKGPPIDLGAAFPPPATRVEKPKGRPPAWPQDGKFKPELLGAQPAGGPPGTTRQSQPRKDGRGVLAGQTGAWGPRSRAAVSRGHVGLPAATSKKTQSRFN